MRLWLATRGVQPSKALGQNFLHDANQVRRIVAAAELAAHDRVLEIGPGLGPLTEPLLDQSSEVLAIEKDARLIEALRERFGTHPRLHLEHADALEWLRAAGRDWRGWKVVSNLPYSVASPILVELAQADHPPDRLVVTLQLEVVQRLLAEPDTKDYGLLTLLLQLRFAPREWFRIPPTCFFPTPEVDSANVCFVRRAEEALSAVQRATFRRVIHRAFSQRRKMMLKLLKTDWPAETLTGAFAAAGLNPTARAEHATLAQYILLARHLQTVDPNR